MAIELERVQRDQAVASLQRYLEAELDERVGNVAAGALLGFILEEIAPLVYNQAVAQVRRSACRSAWPRWTWKCMRTSSSIGADATPSPPADVDARQPAASVAGPAGHRFGFFVG